MRAEDDRPDPQAQLAGLFAVFQDIIDAPAESSSKIDRAISRGVRTAIKIEECAEDIVRIDAEFAQWFLNGVMAPVQLGVDAAELTSQVRLYIANQVPGAWLTERTSPRSVALLELLNHGQVVFGETMVLVASGYPVGAFARWRTLHELIVVARILSKNRLDLSQRYLDSRLVELDRRVKSGLLLRPAPRRSKAERALAREIELKARLVIATHGTEIATKSNGWAAPLKPSGRIRFDDLERLAGVAKRRKKYIEASTHIHLGRLGSVMALDAHRYGSAFTGRRYDDFMGAAALAVMGMDELVDLLLREVARICKAESARAWGECQWRPAEWCATAASGCEHRRGVAEHEAAIA